jgi:hypothetical protein
MVQYIKKMVMCQNNDTTHFLLSRKIKDNIRNRTFRLQKINIKIRSYANNVAVGRKFRQNEGLCNSLIISNDTFIDKKRGCN